MTACPGRLVRQRRLPMCLTCGHVDVTQASRTDAPAYPLAAGGWDCARWVAHALSLGAIRSSAAPTDRGVAGFVRGGVDNHSAAYGTTHRPAALEADRAGRVGAVERTGSTS